MPVLANRMQGTKGSAINRVAQRVRDLKEEGQEIIDFSIGVPNFLPPEHVYEAAHEDISHDKGTYLPGRGTKQLVQAFRSRMKEDGFEYKEEEIVSGLGGKNLLFNIMLALLNEGDEVLIPTPYWTTYPDQVKLLGGASLFPVLPGFTKLQTEAGTAGGRYRAKSQDHAVQQSLQSNRHDLQRTGSEGSR